MYLWFPYFFSSLFLLQSTRLCALRKTRREAKGKKMILLYFFSFHFKYYFTFFCCSAYDFIYNIIFLCCCCCCCERRALNWAVLQSKNLIVFELILSFLLTFWLTFWEWISIKQFFAVLFLLAKTFSNGGECLLVVFLYFILFVRQCFGAMFFFSLLLFLLLFFRGVFLSYFFRRESLNWYITFEEKYHFARR